MKRNAFVLGLTLALLCGPVLTDLAAGGHRRAFHYVAADAFYYLTVARNMADHGTVSFDTQRGTNGFHPLWQVGLGATYAGGRVLGLGDHHMVTLSVLLSLLLLALGVVLLARAMQRASGGHITPLFALVPLGIYGLLVSPMWLSFSPKALALQNLGEGTMPLYGTLWSYANGMETGAVICAFGLLAFLYVTRPFLDSDLNAVLYGLVLSLLILSRLDHVFMAAPFAAAATLQAWTDPTKRRLRRTGLLLAGLCAPVALYLLLSWVTIGSAFPLSGRVKTTFPLLSNDYINLLKTFDQHLRSGKWLALGWRLTQLFVPMIVAALYLPRAFRLGAARGGVALSVRYHEDRFEQFVAFWALGVLLLGLYNLLYVPHGHHGHWYFPVSTLFVTLAVIQSLSRLRLHDVLSRRYGLAACAVACAALSLLFFARLHRTPDYHHRLQAFFFEEAPRVRQYYQGSPIRLYSVDDGIVAFGTGFPTLSGTGLTADREAFFQHQAGRLGNLAVSRGHDRFTSFTYLNANPGGLHPRTPSARIGQWLRRAYRLEHPERYHFSIEYQSPHLQFGIIRVTHRDR